MPHLGALLGAFRHCPRTPSHPREPQQGTVEGPGILWGTGYQDWALRIQSCAGDQKLLEFETQPTDGRLPPPPPLALASSLLSSFTRVPRK